MESVDIFFKWKCYRRLGRGVEFIATNDPELARIARQAGFKCIKRKRSARVGTA